MNVLLKNKRTGRSIKHRLSDLLDLETTAPWFWGEFSSQYLIDARTNITADSTSILSNDDIYIKIGR